MPRIPDYQCHECGTLYDQRNKAIECCDAAKKAKQERAKRLRCTCSLWSDTGAGFGFGVWRVIYPNNFVVWTVAIGPLSIYLRYA